MVIIETQFTPKPQQLINGFLAFFIMHDIQVAVGIQGFQRVVYMDAKHDAWVSVLISGIATHIVTFVIIKTMMIYESSDLYGIHEDVYGKLIGKLFNVFYIFYCLLAFLVIMQNYIEVVQAWMFPEVPTWVFSISLLVLVIYGVTGGLRVIIGICFFNVIFTFWMVVLLLFPLKYSNLLHLLPLFESNITDMLRGAFKMTMTVLGFEIFYVIFPYFKEKNQVQKYAQIGILLTTSVYLVLMVIAIAFFSPGQLEENIWGTLSLFKIVKIPFIERFEYVAIAYWMIIILPNLMLYMWASVRGMERIFKSKAEKFLWIYSTILFIVSLFLKTRLKINALNDFVANIGFYLAFCYPFVLYFIVLVKKKWRLKEQRG